MGKASPYRVVLFDWQGTLAFYSPIRWWVERALLSLDRAVETDVIEAVRTGWFAAIELPEVVESESRIDCSADFHRTATMRKFELAGIDTELADALYRLELDAANHPLFPDVPNVLTAVRNLDVKLVLVSDVHFDLRPGLTEQGIGQLFDAYVLSFEHGVQKPDPKIFSLALEAVGAEPHQALMVGDRASTDGGAAAVGITTLILSRLLEMGPRGLDVVINLLTDQPSRADGSTPVST
jgi:HAD superfamily hydrolase (TIGR01509 family)